MADSRTRKAALRAAHQKGCANAKQTAVALNHAGEITNGASLRGCTCSPSFYTFYRDYTKATKQGRLGVVIKGPRIRDRREAAKELRALQTKIDSGRLDHAERPRREVTLPEWADEFESQLQARVKAGDLADRSRREYMDSVRRAVDAIGHEQLRHLGPPELRRFYDTLSKLTPAGRLRHLRHLNLCLEAAVDDGLMDENPLPRFKKKLRLRAPKRGKAPFEDGELVRLWTAYRQLKIPAVYLHAARFAVETGMRLGEVVALDWPNVDLTSGRVRVEFTYSDRDGLGKPKGHKERDIFLTTEAQKVLAEWVRVTGAQDEGPVFPNPETAGRLVPRSLERNLTRAMTKAGIPREHPDLRLPRSFHSLRYTTSNLMQRRGYHPRLIEQTLGHGSLELTYGVYGGWTPEQLQAEAMKSES